MVKVFPLRGVFYNEEKISSPTRVTSPPYDVIDGGLQDQLYSQSNFNIIRLILGKEFPGDNEYNNKYLRAAAFLDGWLRHEILISDPKPAFYVYEQRFVYRRKKFVRLGFLGLIRLEEAGKAKILPHEETFSRPKLDRLQLMRSTSSNLEAIFGLYSDPQEKLNKILKKFTKRKPLVAAKDQDGVWHRVWRVNLKSPCGKIAELMKDKTVFIADGHHRYEAALRYKEEMKVNSTKFSEDESYNHALMYFTPLEDKGLKILPIHRALQKLPYFDPVKFEHDLKEYFDLAPYPAAKKNKLKILRKLMLELEKKGHDGHAFGLYLGENKFYLLALKPGLSAEELVEEEKSKTWKNLDTVILDAVVFRRLLSISASENHIRYLKDEIESLRLVDEGECHAVFYLNPTKLEELAAIAGKLEKLPHKSTYFYPKLLSGLMINKLSAGEKIEL